MSQVRMEMLGSLCTQVRGIAYGKDEIHESPVEDTVPLLRATNILETGELDLANVLHVNGSRVSQKQLLKKGDVLISASTGSKSAIGKPARVWTNGEVTFGAFCKALRPNTKVVNVDYFWFLFCRPEYRSHISNVVGGANINNIRNEHIDEMLVPLPPLATQQHIARVLEQADRLRKQAQQMERELNQLAQSLFLEMFGEYFYDKAAFEGCAEKIADLVTIIDYRGKTPEKTEAGVPLITAKNVKQGYINPEPREFIAEETYSTWMRRGYPEDNDVLFTTEAPLGNVAKLGKYERVVIGQRLLDLRCGRQLKPDYLVFALQNELIQQAILARSTGSTVKGIRSKEFEKISIPVPPIELQIRFSDSMAQIKKIDTEQFERSAKIESLFESAMQRAFNGELTAPERKAA